MPVKCERYRTNLNPYPAASEFARSKGNFVWRHHWTVWISSGVFGMTSCPLPFTYRNVFRNYQYWWVCVSHQYSTHQSSTHRVVGVLFSCLSRCPVCAGRDVMTFGCLIGDGTVIWAVLNACYQYQDWVRNTFSYHGAIQIVWPSCRRSARLGFTDIIPCWALWDFWN